MTKSQSKQFQIFYKIKSDFIEFLIMQGEAVVFKGRANELPDWLRPRKGIPKMFENPILEKLSHVHPATPLVIYVPIIIFMLYKSVKIFDTKEIIFLFFFGFFIWTQM